MNGPPHCSRSQRDVLPGRRRGLHPLAVGAEERRRLARPASARFGTVRSGSWPAAARSRRSHRGRVSDLGREPQHRLRGPSSPGSPGCPSRGRARTTSRASRSARGAGRAGPLDAARRSSSRVPIQYIWKNVCGLAATTSSTGLLANERSPIAVPRAAAARATATSPSGCTACTPVGEISTGIEIVLAHHRRRQVALRRQARRRAGRSRARRRRRCCRDR